MPKKVIRKLWKNRKKKNLKGQSRKTCNATGRKVYDRLHIKIKLKYILQTAILNIHHLFGNYIAEKKFPSAKKCGSVQ